MKTRIQLIDEVKAGLLTLIAANQQCTANQYLPINESEVVVIPVTDRNEESMLGKLLTVKSNPNKLRNVEYGKEDVNGKLIDVYERVGKFSGNSYIAAKVEYWLLEKGKSVKTKFISTAPLSVLGDDRITTLLVGAKVVVKVVENTYNGATRPQAEFTLAD
jgi:hypothetical protein